jgi:hypothetical protein
MLHAAARSEKKQHLRKGSMRKKDLQLENYLPWLADRASPSNRHLKAAQQAYARFQETAHARHRKQAWEHIHAAAPEVGRRRAPRRRRSRRDP